MDEAAARAQGAAKEAAASQRRAQTLAQEGKVELAEAEASRARRAADDAAQAAELAERVESEAGGVGSIALERAQGAATQARNSAARAQQAVNQAAQEKLANEQLHLAGETLAEARAGEERAARLAAVAKGQAARAQRSAGRPGADVFEKRAQAALQELDSELAALRRLRAEANASLESVTPETNAYPEIKHSTEQLAELVAKVEGMAKDAGAALESEAVASNDAKGVDLADLPSAPDLPEAVARRPKGVELPPAQPEQFKVVGRWELVKGSHAADFLPGGFSSCRIAFRSDGIAEITRVFGEGKGISQTWQVGYRLESQRERIHLGEEPKLRPPTRTLRGFTVGSTVASPAKLDFPVSLSAKAAPNGLLELGGNLYQPAKE